MKRSVVIGLLTAVLVTTGAANAIDPRHPNWPCHQIKVPQLSIAAFWSGPAMDDVRDAWKKDPAIENLVVRLAARRTPLKDAEKAASDFITGNKAEKERKAKLLFAGLFATLNNERTQVMDGIERFAQRQQELRKKLTTELTELRAQEDAAGPDASIVDKLGNEVAWDTRVFDERRHTISYVCEVPSTIERRLFALARAIQQKLN
ncbi:MAG TPA: hypothetical protein VFS63_13995 [Pseudolabrys sp.]|jgi:hypothetical protein|nr:hypothetical protein [Pseudolabrys sp.]